MNLKYTCCPVIKINGVELPSASFEIWAGSDSIQGNRIEIELQHYAEDDEAENLPFQKLEIRFDPFRKRWGVGFALEKST